MIRSLRIWRDSKPRKSLDVGAASFLYSEIMIYGMRKWGYYSHIGNDREYIINQFSQHLTRLKEKLITFRA